MNAKMLIFYVYDKDKIIILAYKPLSNDDEVHYYAYDFSDKRVSYKQDFDSRRYYQQHDADYHEENMTNSDMNRSYYD
ncbi:cystatin-like fold lipoprotein [Staphylococcus aureus]|nr:cystatin-like fold lipoprotein [Staphylococcus aureus]